MGTSDFAKRLAQRLIEQLEAGTVPWQQDWAPGQILSPYNPTTGNRYRGVNVLALMVTGRGDLRNVGSSYPEELALGDFVAWQSLSSE
jgi:antirestriction protein ArdC